MTVYRMNAWVIRNADDHPAMRSRSAPGSLGQAAAEISHILAGEPNFALFNNLPRRADNVANVSNQKVTDAAGANP